jgi:hypothetical protein
MEKVFSMWFVARCYKQDSLKQRVSCLLKLSAVQLSEVKSSSWLVGLGLAAQQSSRDADERWRYSLVDRDLHGRL